MPSTGSCNPYYNGKDIQSKKVTLMMLSRCNPYYNGKDIQFASRSVAELNGSNPYYNGKDIQLDDEGNPLTYML